MAQKIEDTFGSRASGRSHDAPDPGVGIRNLVSQVACQQLSHSIAGLLKAERGVLLAAVLRDGGAEGEPNNSVDLFLADNKAQCRLLRNRGEVGSRQDSHAALRVQMRQLMRSLLQLGTVYATPRGLMVFCDGRDIVFCPEHLVLGQGESLQPLAQQRLRYISLMSQGGEGMMLFPILYAAGPLPTSTLQ